MIALPWFFLLLVSLPAFTSQQAPIYSSRKSIIDWTTCGLETKCLCVDVASDPLKMIARTKPVLAPTKTSLESEEGLCNIGVHQKFFDDNFALFQLQVIGVITDLKSNPELILYRETEPLFGCKFNSETQKVELVGDEKVLKKFSIEPFYDRSRFETDNIICAVTVKSATTLSKEIRIEGKYKDKVTVMKFLNVDYTHDLNDETFFLSRGTKCDPYLFNDLTESQEYHILPIKNRDKDILNCGEGDSPSYTMRYDKVGVPAGTEMKQLECVKNEIGGYNYKLVKDSDATDADGNKISEDVMIPESYIFYCAANIGETCKDKYKCDPNADPTCPIFSPGKKGQAAELKCPGDKWLIQGEYLELTVQPICQRDKASNENEPVFHFTLPSGKTEPIPDARCFTNYNCKVKSKLILPVCDDETTCGAVDGSNDNILKCKDENKQMTIIAQEAGSVASNLSSYTCNPSTGSYFNETTILSARSRVRCIGEMKRAPVAAAKFSDGQIMGFIVGACVITGVILVAIVLAIYFYCKSSKKIRKREKKFWVTMKRADRIERCKEDFAKVLEATVETATHILVGLIRMELLLDTETEEPECWEEVYKFVERLQGAVEHLDAGIWHMLNRYLYIQAKKIIDKHGWLAPERITNKNPKGLIRAVAIRLLSFAMNDPKNEETEDFVASGYSQLGFKAVEQYPHCGVMWSLIMHTRAIKTKKGDKPVRLNSLKFLETLMKIAGKGMMVVPKEDVLPVLGSVEEQAAYAIGGTPIFAFNVANSTNILLALNTSDQGAVTKSYFKGMGDSLWRFSMQTVLDAFGMWPNPNPKFLEKVRNDAPEAEWNELALAAVKVMIYYGLTLDAKRMYVRFFEKKSVAALEKLQLEQKNFGEAVEKVMEELRDWFAARTDKEELKKKPEYNVDANAKLDDRVGGNGASNVEQNSKDNKPATSSGGSTNTEQAPKQAPSDPKDAAAPAAAAPAAEAPAAANP